MDLKRLAVVLSQRLAPVYIAIALSWVTGYFVFTIGGIGLAIALELAWPLLRPLFDVLYEELMAQHSQAQAQRRTALLKAFLPFFQAYKTVLTTYPPAMLTASASEVAAQLETFAEAIRDVKARRGPEPDDPFAPACEEAYEVVRTVSLTLRDFRDWRLKDCQTWRQELLAMLAKGRIAALRHAVQHVMQAVPGRSGTPAWRKPRMLWRLRLSTRSAAGPVSSGPTPTLQCASVWRLCSASTRSIARRGSNPT